MLEKNKLALSIDVGIKNFAYCVIGVENNDAMKQNIFQMHEWRCINLVGDDKNVKMLTPFERAQALFDVLDLHLNEWRNVTDVLIERQPPANKVMVEMSHWIYSYFMLKMLRKKEEHPGCNVVFVSAKNKLSVSPNAINVPDSLVEANSKSSYSKRKRYACELTKLFIAHNENALKFFAAHTGKSDDLADCFLQAVWYLQKKCGEKKKRMISKNLNTDN